MKKKRLLLCALLLALMLSTTARADSGPKPSIRVRFLGLEEGPCYATLLSKTDGRGPFSVYDGENNAAGAQFREENEAVWQALVDYKDPDGFYFLQNFQQVDKTGKFAWTYYPPSTFKILLYYPDSGEFVSGEILEKFAFHSYYVVRQSDGVLKGEQATEYGWEIISLLIRVALTIGVELLIARWFDMRRRWETRTIVAANLITQTALNVGLYIVGIFALGATAFVCIYAVLEILVFAAEAVTYRHFLQVRMPEGKGARHPVVYALVANAASLGVGLLLAQVFPSIF